MEARTLAAPAAAILLAAAVPTAAGADGGRYLIITPDSYEDEIAPLAEWKTRKGMLARVATLAETGYSSVEIRNFVTDAVENWDPPPEYVLLVGDMGDVPMPWLEDGYSDTAYGNVDNDMFVEIHPGRLPAANASQVEV
ncbi:MAG: C25 family cysteine peptidase, partial [Myxococcota bacterium]|nr:C25 family cysteine peptidase [Myxococcota bacterium]